MRKRKSCSNRKELKPGKSKINDAGRNEDTEKKPISCKEGKIEKWRKEKQTKRRKKEENKKSKRRSSRRTKEIKKSQEQEREGGQLGSSVTIRETSSFHFSFL